MKLKLKNSAIYKSEVHNYIPGGAHTYSKGDDQFPEIAPAAIMKGKGSYVWDIDGNKYLDCSMGLSSVSLGHAYSEILESVKNELDKGVNFQRPSYIELEMAKEFLSLIPCHEMIKFAKNGSTATTAAIKIARAYTGKKLVAFPEDHPFYSYDDWFIGKTPCNKGVPSDISNLTVTFKSCDISSLQELFKKYPNQIAAVITEPERLDCSSCNCELSQKNFLDKAIKLTKSNGALFILDEMVTGYKVGFPGAITEYNLNPDMATWGKGIANGFSFCALTGKKEVMQLGGINSLGEEKVFLISTTHGGETHSIRAGLKTLEIFKKYNVIKHNQSVGDKIIELSTKAIIDAELDNYIKVIPCNWVVGFVFHDKNRNVSLKYRTLFMQTMIENGVLFQGIFIPCYSHSETEIEMFNKIFKLSLVTYKKAIEESVDKYLIGESTKPVFRKYN